MTGVADLVQRLRVARGNSYIEHALEKRKLEAKVLLLCCNVALVKRVVEVRLSVLLRLYLGSREQGSTGDGKPSSGEGA